MFNSLKKLLANYPTRVYLYTLLLAIVGLLVGYGVVAANDFSLWVGVGSALLGVSAVETVHSKVSPTNKL